MSSKMITLISSDKQSFEVDEKVAELSEIIKNSIEDTGTPENGIPLPNVDSKTLAKVTEYLNKHLNEAGNDDELKNWDNQFISNNSNCNTLFELILAANYMNIKGLLDLTCQAVADDIKAKSAEEVRKYFNIANDFTPEEEAQVRKENQWAFE